MASSDLVVEQRGLEAAVASANQSGDVDATSEAIFNLGQFFELRAEEKMWTGTDVEVKDVHDAT